MKKTLLLTAFLICFLSTVHAQVGIGTPMPNASSQLEVVAADKGVLIPKISLKSSTDATTITNGNVNSLLVFNTATISDIKPGYYYWYEDKWNRIVISTEISASPGTVIYNPNNQQFTYIDASGNTQIIDIAAIVKANETITSLVNNGGGSYTYTNEAGTAVNIDVIGDVTSNFSTIVNNPAVTNIIQNIVNKTEGNVSFNSTTNQFTYVDASGNTQIVDISTIVKANETITTLDKDASNNGQYTYTSENATVTTIDVINDVINNSSVIMNNSTFITQLTNIIKNNETLTSLVYDAAANTLTYTDEKAVPNVINLVDLVGNAETQTTLVYDPVAKTLTYNGESGTPTVINLVDLVGDSETVTTQTQDPATGVITYTNEAGTATTAQVTSTDAGNILTVGTDGGSLLTPTAITNATTVSNTSAVNSLTTTVNGVTGTAVPIINTNETSLTGANLTTTVNGVASTVLDLTPAITAATTNTLSLTGNALTSTINGVAATSNAVSGVSNASTVNTSTVTINGITSTGAPIINSNETSLTGASLTTTVNGVASTPLDLTPIITAATTNTLGLTGNTLTSTVNGVASTSDAVSGVSNASAVNTSTVTVNGITSTGAPIINSNTTSLTGASLTTTVNGVASTPLDLTPIITAATTNSLGLTGNTLTSMVNGVVATSDAVSSVSNTSTVNTSMVTVNGITSTGAPIINSNTTSLTGASLTTTVNGVASTALDLTPAIKANETVTTLAQDLGTGTITYSNEAATAATAQVTSTNAGNILTVGTDGGSLLTPTAITNATTVSNTSAVNSLTTTVNGVAGTAVPIINTNETSLNAGNLTTTVNGVASAPLDLTPIITAATTNTLGLAGNTLTSTVNGVAATSDAVSGVSNASAVNTSTVTVNGITSTGAPIINSNTTSLTGASLTTTVNGVASTALDLAPAIKSGETITTITPIVNSGSVIATYTNEAGGTPVEIQQTVTKQVQDPMTGIISFINEDGVSSDSHVISTDPSNIITVGPDGGALLTPTTLTAATTVSNTSAVNSLSTTVNGVTGTAVPIINTNETSLTGANLTTTVNGVASTALDLTPAITAATTNTLGLTGNTLTSTVNGVAATSDAVSSVSNASAVNTSTVTVNGITSAGAPIINSNAVSLAGASLTTTVNGVTSTALDLTPAITAATTNTLTAVNGELISTVNGVASTPAVPVLISADNGLTAANGNVQLGGTLMVPTTIATDFANTLSITGLMHGMPMDEILVTDPGGGIIRTIKPEELNFNNWSINGNFGTIPQVHFLGTHDDADLVFKRNFIVSGKIQVNNTSFGVNALNSDPTGQFNAAFGTSSLLENTTGNNNTAVGYNALTANATGSNNTAAGFAAGSGSTVGSGNTFIGNNANPSTGAIVNNATAIGNNSRVATDNSLVLGGIDADAVNVGIGTDAPTNTMHIKPVTGVDPIRAEGLQASVSGTDNIIVADALGVFRTITPSSLIPATTVSNNSTLNSLTTTVNGVTGTAVNIVNSNTTSLTGATLNTAVNGVASTALDLTPAITAATTNTLSLAGNTLTSTVNGVAATSDAVSGVSNASAVNTSTVTVNGITSTGAPIINSNTTSLAGASLTTTVNGIASTALDLTPAIKANETITTITPVVTTGNTIASYTNEAAGTPVEIKETITSLKDVVTQVTDQFGQLFDVHTLTYTDETNTPNPIDLSVLVKGVETLTSLVYDGANHSLIYNDEDGNATEFKMVDLIGESETITTLEVNATTGTLDYTNEDKVLTQLDLGAAVKEPWFSTATHMGATLNTEDIYTNGWVGIGYTTASGAPNEKLRVNGAISTVNTYYADYVFEDYFKGKSEIKADYKFKRLPEIEDYIKKYNHLPGITPINRLEKTKEGYAFNMSELSIQLLEKTEEIYLHIIEQNKEIEAKDKEIKELKEASKAMNLRLEKLEKLIAEKNN